MYLLAFILGLLLIGIVLWDAFETIVLPRTIARDLRLTRLFYKGLWRLWSAVVKRIPAGERVQGLLGVFGPLSLLMLFCLWSTLLIFGFALTQWGLHLPINVAEEPGSGSGANVGFGMYLYQSGVTFYTLGYGDVTPRSALGRVVDVAEAGVGFGLLAIVVSYLPVIYQAFSRREVTPLLLDSRAGSPPTAGELIRRHAEADMMTALLPLLEKYEMWAANLLEGFISYPVLAYYRAQHERLAWLSALTTILDTTALIQAGFEIDAAWCKPLRWQAQQTFAISRHVLVDLAYLLDAPPVTSFPDRLPEAVWQRWYGGMRKSTTSLRTDEEAWAELQRLRAEYEPFVFGLASFLFLTVPAWCPEDHTADSWETSAWDQGERESHF